MRLLSFYKPKISSLAEIKREKEEEEVINEFGSTDDDNDSAWYKHTHTHDDDVKEKASYVVRTTNYMPKLSPENLIYFPCKK